MARANRTIPASGKPGVICAARDRLADAGQGEPNGAECLALHAATARGQQNLAILVRALAVSAAREHFATRQTELTADPSSVTGG